MADEPDDSVEDSWQGQSQIVPIVNLIKRQMTVGNQQLVDDSPCFGWLYYEDDGTVCPEAEGCDLHTHCKQVWQMAQVKSAEATIPAKKEKKAVVDETSVGTSESSDKAKRTKQVRDKWAGTDKFQRKGYTDLGRHCDKLLNAFITRFGPLSHLPAIWNKTNFAEKYGKLGATVISSTTSYHAIVHGGEILTRIWTNASKRCIVDVSPELVKAVAVYAETYNQVEKIPPISVPKPIPKNSWMKVRPCTHRVVVDTEKAASDLANIIRKQYRL